MAALDLPTGKELGGPFNSDRDISGFAYKDGLRRLVLHDLLGVIQSIIMITAALHWVPPHRFACTKRLTERSACCRVHYNAVTVLHKAACSSYA